MIISLIFIVVSLSTIDADRYHPSFNTRQLEDFDSGKIIQLYPTQLQYCTRLWNSVNDLPRSEQFNFFRLMTAMVQMEEMFQAWGKKSKIRKNKNYIKVNSETSDLSFHDFCRIVWDRVLEYSPKSQTRIKNSLLQILEDAKDNLANNEPAFNKQLFSPDYESEFTDESIKKQILDNVYKDREYYRR